MADLTLDKESIEALRFGELRKELRHRGLSTHGNKSHLQARLLAHCNSRKARKHKHGHKEKEKEIEKAKEKEKKAQEAVYVSA